MKLLITTAAGLFLACALPAIAGTESLMSAYRDCTQSAMPAMDDGKSDAEVVAIGLHAQCRAQFEAIYQDDPKLSRQQWQAIVQPHVVQSILHYRAALQRHKATPAPAAKAMRPTS